MNKHNKPEIKLIQETVFEKARQRCKPTLYPKRHRVRAPYIRHYYKTLDKLLHMRRGKK
ncbi:hypothetical protein TELCIR_14490 [Teladorsagia circumcincta]|nr:hypothetical protein TELCIR_14490 [Teladorsagia circumcincta]